MSMNSGWGAGEMEGSFEAFDQQEAYGANGEASYEMEGNGLHVNPYGEAESPYGEAEQEAEGVFDETEEMELASDLLSLGSEAELNQAIGELMHRAAHAVGGSINRDVGMALGNALKTAAQQTVAAAGAPGAGVSAAGAPGAGVSAAGGPAAGGPAAGEVFGIETEGLSGEDQEFEVTRRFVRFAGAAAGRAARAPRGINPRAIVRSALVRAARRWAPGMLRRWGRPFRGPDRYRRRWPGFRSRWGAPGLGYGAGYPYPPQPYPPQPYPPQYPGAPGMEGAQQPAPSFGMGGGPAGVGGTPEPSMGQGMPDSAGGPESGGGGEGPVPPAGRWTRQGGQLIIHL